MDEHAVRELGARIGYGRVLQLCEQLAGGAELTVGPCAALLVACPCAERGAAARAA